MPKTNFAGTITRFRRECSDPSIGSFVLRDDAQQLYQWMVGPFADQLTSEDRDLTFELDGVLAGIPVQALMSPDGRYLGDRFSVLVSSGYGTTEVTPPGATASVLMVANPAITGESAARFPSLPDALKEAGVVRNSF